MRLLHAMTVMAAVALAANAIALQAGEVDPRAEIEAGKAMLAEGDALADEGKPNEAILRYKAAFERLLPTMRKLPFHEEVKGDVTRREALKDFLLEELDREIPPEKFRAGELGMQALGFIPRDVDLKSMLVQVYSEEIAAFYDPRTRTMHMIEESEESRKKGPSFLERFLLGKQGGFDKEENRTVLAHELTHALADQHFDLAAMQEAVQDDDDRSLALSALIEGEAMLTMMGAQMDDWEGDAVALLPYEDLDRTFRVLGPLLPSFGGKSLRGAPPVIRESLLFPYLRGLVFNAALTNKGGWEAINDAYKNPPLSTEQILHPEKYTTDIDRPMSIELGDLDAGEDWEEVGRNVVGEMQLAVLLNRGAAAGWDGDRYAVFAGPDDRLGLVWMTTWDSEEDAREFAASYARFQTRKLGENAEELDEIPDRLRRQHDGASYFVVRRGSDVAVVEGFPRPLARAMVRAAFQAVKTELTSEALVAAE